MTDSFRPPPPAAWQVYALIALVLVASFWALSLDRMSEASVARLAVGAMTLLALMSRKTPPAGGALAFGLSELAGDLVAVTGGA